MPSLSSSPSSVKYDRACAALAEARSIAEAKNIRDQAIAMACGEADQNQRRKPKDMRLERLRRLRADDVSLERAWREISTAHAQDRAADSTVEALMFSLRSGIGALADPNTVRQLCELSDAQIRQIAVRLQKLKPHVAPAWVVQDLEVLLAARSKVRG